MAKKVLWECQLPLAKKVLHLVLGVMCDLNCLVEMTQIEVLVEDVEALKTQRTVVYGGIIQAHKEERILMSEVCGRTIQILNEEGKVLS